MSNTLYVQAFNERLDQRSKELRTLILDGYTAARRGHLGSYFSVVEILRVLYDEILTLDPKNPSWGKRDRFILSKGHGSLALYAILADHGFFPKRLIKGFVTFNSILGQHLDSRKVPGVEGTICKKVGEFWVWRNSSERP